VFHRFRRAAIELGLLASFVLVGVLLTVPAGARTLAEVQRDGTLLVGVDIPYGVMEFLDENGQPAGIDIDIAKEIASGIGVGVEFRTMPFDELFAALKEDTVDLVLSAVTITKERQEFLLFSAPYLSASTVLAVAKSNESVESVADLSGGKLGVLSGTLGESLAETSERLQSLTAVAYSNNDERIADLVAGKIDAAIVHFLIRTDLPVRVIGEPLFQNFYGVVANLGNTALMGEVDRILRDMKRDGRLEDIKKRYVQ
jgi:ABC-type amino acid transport substrate-binding protein